MGHPIDVNCMAAYVHPDRVQDMDRMAPLNLTQQTYSLEKAFRFFRQGVKRWTLLLPPWTNVSKNKDIRQVFDAIVLTVGMPASPLRPDV